MTTSSSTAQRRERAKIERRAAILQGATRVFCEHGLVAATMDEVARVSGVSKGALYLYFQSKDELYLEIATSALSQLVESLERVDPDGCQTGREWLRRLAVTYIEHALSDMGRFVAAISWLTSGYSLEEDTFQSSKYRGRIERLHQLCSDAVCRGQEDGSLDLRGPPQIVAVQLWAAILGLILAEHRCDELKRRLPELPSISGIAHDFVDRLIV